MMGVQLLDAAVSRYKAIWMVKQRISSSRVFMSDGAMLVRAVHRRTVSSAATSRLRRKREDVGCIEFDSAFSRWKILVGGFDWKDHSAGKPGAERYRTQNLPTYTSPGVYELGVAPSVACRRGKHPSRQLERNSIIPVYLGQAENVRARVQSYGRDGAHLENSSDSLLLFSDIFSRDSHIVYRWAAMKSKKEAERSEDELLGKYDYGWNKRNNGNRRAEEIRRKLGLCCARASLLHNLGRLLVDCFSRFGEEVKRGVLGFQSAICREGLGHGVGCRKAPVKGRRRCAQPEHQGMKAHTNDKD